MIRKMVARALFVGIAFFGTVSGASAVEMRPILTLEMAIKIADTCEAVSIEKGWRPVIIAIYDQTANLKYFRRMEDAFLGSIQVAQLKAQTAANFKRSTRTFGEIVYRGERPHGAQHVPGVVIFPGGLPIMTKDGHSIGGVGVSGATSDQDEVCAQAGLDAIADLL